MHKEVTKEEKEPQSGKVRFIIINFMRLILLATFIGGIYYQRNLVLTVSIIAFIFTFLPQLFERFFNIKLPAELEVLMIFFIYGLLYFGKIKGFYSEFWLVDILVNLLSASVLGFVGLTIMYSLYKDNKLNASPFFVAFFAFLFAVAIGSLAEVVEFTLDNLLGFNLQKSVVETMKDMIVNLAGAFIVSSLGYKHMKEGKSILISKYVSGFIDRNSKATKNNDENSAGEVIQLVKKGEGNTLEFKSTLRKNLHTNEYDKKIEHATLKTVVAYLNSDGGTLLVGVSDKGEITGLHHDEFVDKDKLNLYFTNLIKQHIGSEYLPFIKYDIYHIGGKEILKVDCKASNKHVFLKHQGEEEFYVRNGASSAKLAGNSLIEYINNKFSK